MADVSAAGATLHIGDTLISDVDSEDLTSLQGASYTEIGRVQSLPSVGDTVQTITFTELGTARVKRVAF